MTGWVFREWGGGGGGGGRRVDAAWPPIGHDDLAVFRVMF